tara:strand:+ start:1449 stop:1730 length:282 start_codon:yes stop_codon:yes gene_type:complete
MAKFSQKLMGKEVGSAAVYAQPHTMDGKKMTKAPAEFGTNPGFPPNRSKLDTLDVSIGNISKSAGNEPIKTSGIQMRGTGCATKGTMSRGPMA